MQITDEYAARLNEYFKPGKPLTAEQYGEMIEPFAEHLRSVLMLHVCEGKSLTEISAIRDSNVMRIQQIFGNAERMMNNSIRNLGKTPLRDLLDGYEDGNE